jgi:hypothetical protein
MSLASERKAASASTSDHHLMPIIATRSFRVSAGPGFGCVTTLLAPTGRSLIPLFPHSSRHVTLQAGANRYAYQI